MISVTYLVNASNVLGDTNEGLSGTLIAKYCAGFAAQYDIDIPYAEYPFVNCSNKRTALLENLKAFKPDQQYAIIKELCELDYWSNNPKIKDLKIKLISRYSSMFEGAESIDEVFIEETKHWLEQYDRAKQLYLSALEKLNNDIYLRNSIDDLRLSLEMLMMEIFDNSKSLENQIGYVGSLVASKGGSKEFTNMFQKLLDYYGKYQNNYVKHDSLVNEIEADFIVELTSSFMKHIVRLAECEEVCKES